ncbi:adenylate/guanylate cyclase domain-containing protein [Micromonospora sp. HUAS LYJ1]|uniref:AAA family ATPase n=1 Tax=Micromonospora sp. HUAS LYJ1 TaxID=3061626 RepID=UPI002672E715|nr:adenylate/guanylate cyclase domain-containing protein [Micromonospora sp. HUAS LYJ1]WKU08520.1 adenylate/guanylate cyclase domain-containing protein [Micromonospora sp. HUAS LYJ1]
MDLKCGHCSRAAGPDDRFCGGCGQALTLTCASCGHGNSPEANFCTNCGQPLRDHAVTVQEDRRQVSVLFIDIVDFTTYAERADPEQARSLQQAYFATVRKLVHQYGGVVEKYIGDAVMALFGAPVATDNDALRCVRAGLELQRNLARQAAGPHPPLGFRVGVATGEALVDLSATRDGGQAFVTGDVVNTASRLQALAPTGGVVVDESTWSATRHELDYVDRPPVTLRGRSTVSRIWLAVRARPRTDPQAAELTPMVDREHERGLLVSALHRTVTERTSQLVTVFGPAGVGKSRLLRELSRHAANLPGQRVTWLVGQCPPFGENVTYAALADIVKGWLGAPDTDDPEPLRDRLRDRLRQLDDPHAMRLAGALGPLLGMTGERLNPGETEAAWRRFLLTLAGRGPTVLVFEDMHWADQAMLTFVEQLGAAARGVPLLVVATARPELRERQPAWTGTISGAMSISVPPMHDADIDTLYSLLLGQATLPAASRAPLIEFADGNPLYAQEYARMLMDGGLLEPSVAFDPAGTTDMPRTVQAVIANRLDLLDPADRAVLQAAAVVGVQFWPAPVAAALGRTVEWVERALDRLQRRDMVVELPTSTMTGQPEYRFRHILVRDVCYQRLPRAERVLRHQRTADWLAQLTQAGQQDLAEVLANHRWTAHEIARTVGLDPTPYAVAARTALHRAARRAYELHALENAATLVDRALQVGGAPDPGLELFAAQLALFRDGDAFLVDGGTEALTGLTERLAAVGDRSGAARAWTLLATAAWSRADRSETLRCLDRANAIYAELPESEEKAEALLELARVRMLNAETDPACVAASAAAELAERLRLPEVRANARITLAVARYMAGEEQAYAELAEVAEQCRVDRLVSRRRAVHNLAWAAQEEGDLARSARLVDEGRSLDPGGGHSLATSFADKWARAYYAGDWVAALELGTESTRLPTAEWDLHIVAVSGWMRALRADSAPTTDGSDPGTPTPGATAPDGPDPGATDPGAADAGTGVAGAGATGGADAVGGAVGQDLVAHALVAARRSGFHRVLQSTLAHAALCRAVGGRREEAMQLLVELDEDWSRTRMIPFAEWVPAVGHVAAVLGPDAARLVHDMLARSPRITPWVEAAGRAADATLALGDGDARRAARLFAAAAQGYARMPDTTDHVLTTALSVPALTVAEPAQAAATLDRVRDFADRNGMPGLLRLATRATPDRSRPSR